MKAHPLLLAVCGILLHANSCTSRRSRTPLADNERLNKMMERFGATSYEEFTHEDSLSPEDSEPQEPRQHFKRLVAPQEGVEYEIYQGVMGRPGVDFPVLPRIPKTSFSCRSVKNSGYYADLDTDCQVFHICDEGRKISFLCPNGTIFRQSHLICDWWWTVDCASSVEQYEQSAEQLAYDQRRYRSRVTSSPFSGESNERQQTNVFSNVRYNNIDHERQLPAETGSFVNSRTSKNFNTQQFASSSTVPTYTASNFRNNYYNDYVDYTTQYIEPLTTATSSTPRFQQPTGRSYFQLDRSRPVITTSSTPALSSRKVKPAAVEVVNRGSSRYFSTTTTPLPLSTNNKFNSLGDRATPDPSFNAISTTDGLGSDVYRSTSKPIYSTDSVRNSTPKSTSARGRKLRPVYVQVINRGTPRPLTTTTPETPTETEPSITLPTPSKSPVLLPVSTTQGVAKSSTITSQSSTKVPTSDESSEDSANIEIYRPTAMLFTDEDVLPTKLPSTTTVTQQSKPVIIHSVNRETSQPTAVSYAEFTLNPSTISETEKYSTETIKSRAKQPEQDLFSSIGSMESRSFSSSQNQLLNKEKKSKSNQDTVEKASSSAPTTQLPSTLTTTPSTPGKQPDVQNIQITHRGESNVIAEPSYTTTDSSIGVTDEYTTGDYTGTAFPVYGKKYSANDEGSKSPEHQGSLQTTQKSSNGKPRKPFSYSDAPRRRIISTSTTTPSLIQRALSKRLKTTPLPIPIRTATPGKTTSKPGYVKPTTIRPISKTLLPPQSGDSANVSSENRNPKNSAIETTTVAEPHISGDRTGLEIPPSSGPGTLHSLAAYFENEVAQETTTVPIDFTLSSIVDAEAGTTLRSTEKDIKPPSILTKLTIDSYSSLFSNNTEKAQPRAPERIAVPFLLSPESSVPPREGRKFAVGNEPTQSDEGVSSRTDPTDLLVKEDAPGLRELAQVFSRALSAYLDDPEEFRKVLSEVRPTAPPDSDSSVQPLTTIKPGRDDDEVLDFSDVTKTPFSRRTTAAKIYTSTASPNFSDNKLSTSPEYTTELLETLDKSQSRHYTPQSSSTNIIAEAVNNLFDTGTTTEGDYTLPPGSKQHTEPEYVPEVFPQTAGGVGDGSRPRYGGFQNNTKSLKRVNSASASPTTTSSSPARKPSRNLVPPLLDSPSGNSSSETLEVIFDTFIPEELNNLAEINSNIPKVLSAAGLNPSSPGNQKTLQSHVANRRTDTDSFTSATAPSAVDVTTTVKEESEESLVAANSARFNSQRAEQRYNTLAVSSRKWDSGGVAELNSLLARDGTTHQSEITTNPTAFTETPQQSIRNQVTEQLTESPTTDSTPPEATLLPQNIGTKTPSGVSSALDKLKSGEPKRLVQIDGFSRMIISSRNKVEKVKSLTTLQTNTLSSYTVTPEITTAFNYEQERVTTELPTTIPDESTTTVRLVYPVTRSEDMSTVTPSNTDKETLINSPSSYYKDFDVPSGSLMTPDQLQSLEDLQKMLSLNNATSAFAEKMFNTLDETGKMAFVHMMKQVHTNATVRRLVLLLINRTDEGETFSPNEIKSHLIEALLKHPDEELQLASQELEAPLVTTSGGGDLLQMITARSKTSLDELPPPSSSRTSISKEKDNPESDKRAVELLRSLYTLAARWG